MPWWEGSHWVQCRGQLRAGNPHQPEEKCLSQPGREDKAPEEHTDKVRAEEGGAQWFSQRGDEDSLIVT